MTLVNICTKMQLVVDKGVFLADMGTKEAGEKWGVSQAVVQKWCREGKILPHPTQDKKGSPWHILKDAIPPIIKTK